MQDDAILEMYTCYMRNICGLAMEVIPIDSVEVIPIDPPLQLACGRDGCVRGFSAWIKAQKQNGKHVVDAMRLDWAYLKARGWLARGFADGDYHLLFFCRSQVVSFCPSCFLSYGAKEHGV